MNIVEPTMKRNPVAHDKSLELLLPEIVLSTLPDFMERGFFLPQRMSLYQLQDKVFSGGEVSLSPHD
jgi:hypothetical protein